MPFDPGVYSGYGEALAQIPRAVSQFGEAYAEHQKEEKQLKALKDAYAPFYAELGFQSPEEYKNAAARQLMPRIQAQHFKAGIDELKRKREGEDAFKKWLETIQQPAPPNGPPQPTPLPPLGSSPPAGPTAEQVQQPQERFPGGGQFADRLIGGLAANPAAATDPRFSHVLNALTDVQRLNEMQRANRLAETVARADADNAPRTKNISGVEFVYNPKSGAYERLHADTTTPAQVTLPDGSTATRVGRERWVVKEGKGEIKTEFLNAKDPETKQPIPYLLINPNNPREVIDLRKGVDPLKQALADDIKGTSANTSAAPPKQSEKAAEPKPVGLTDQEILELAKRAKEKGGDVSWIRKNLEAWGIKGDF